MCIRDRSIHHPAVDLGRHIDRFAAHVRLIGCAAEDDPGRVGAVSYTHLIVGVGGITYPGGTGIHVKGTNTIKAFATNFGLHYINIVGIVGCVSPSSLPGS